MNRMNGIPLRKAILSILYIPSTLFGYSLVTLVVHFTRRAVSLHQPSSHPVTTSASSLHRHC